MLIKLAKVNDKEKILRAARQKKITYKGTSIRLSVDFSAENLQAGREWNDIFKILKDKTFQPRIQKYISFRCDRGIKSFPDKQNLNLRELIATRPTLQEIFKKALISEKKQNKKRAAKP